MNQNLAILPKPRIIPPKPWEPKSPAPKPRLKSTKYMTIVFGILQSDSIVFAADTEETGEFMKFSTPKLHSYCRDNGECLVIGGAGPVPSVDTIRQRLGKSFMADAGSFEEIAAMLIRQFYDEHVLSQPDQDFSLIFGGSFKTPEGKYTHRMWISERGAMKDSEGIAAIGAGMEIARTLAKKYVIPSPLPVAELASVHVLRLVKEQAHYCGKESMVWTVSGPDVLTMSERYVRRAEDLSRKIDELNTLVFMALFDSDDSLQFLNARLRTVRDTYTKLSSELGLLYETEKAVNEEFRNKPDGI